MNLIPSMLRTIPPAMLAFAFVGMTSCSGNFAGSEEKTGNTQIATKSQTNDSPANEEALKTINGIASWYSVRTNGGRTTASGRRLDDTAKTAAHKSLPFGTRVRVTCLFNGESEVVRITDRGPYIKGRVIDLTQGTARRLGFYKRGITKVKLEVLSWGDWKYKKS